MREQGEWIGLADGAHRAGGVLTYMQLYNLAVRNAVESRRQGSRWQVRRSSLDRYVKGRVSELNTKPTS